MKTSIKLILVDVDENKRFTKIFLWKNAMTIKSRYIGINR